MSVLKKNAAGETLHQATYGDECPISEAVVRALADAEGVDPVELDARLYDSVDGDALDQVYETAVERGGTFRLEFAVGEYLVVAEAHGRVTVRRPADFDER